MPYPKGKPVWRECWSKKEGHFLLSPDKRRRYHGTAAEVREAALLPFRRRMLADGLKTARLTRERLPEYDLRGAAAYQRREAVMMGAADGRSPVSVHIPATLELLAGAAAWTQGVSVGAFAEAAIRAAVEAVRPFALTRHERAALARLEAAGN